MPSPHDPTADTASSASAPGDPAWLTVLPLGRRLPLPSGSTLLEAARAGGVLLRSSCRNGTCRACIAQVVSGRVGHRIPWPGLSPDERAEGWVLPCVAIADGDVVLHQPRIDGVSELPAGPGGQAGPPAAIAVPGP